MKRKIRIRNGVPLIFCALLANAAFAVDGVLEINHICATQSGCFSSDFAAGYPVIIDGSDGSSYQLTSDLVLPGPGGNGIVIMSPGISIDLNGFEITTADCVLDPTIGCRPTSGFGSGIFVNDGTDIDISIKNGTITGMGRYAVFVNSVQTEIKNLKVRWNGIDGIFAGSGSMVSDSFALENTMVGISTGSRSIVRDSISRNNGSHGILANSTSTISGNTVRNNGGDGINGGNGATISNNMAYLNTFNGIYGGVGSTVTGNSAFGNTIHGIFTFNGSTNSGNTAYGNGGNGIVATAGSTVSNNTARNNTGHGIETSGGGCSVQRNTATINGGFGLVLSSTGAYLENTVRTNTQGTIFGGVSIGLNYCDGNLTCP